MDKRKWVYLGGGEEKDDAFASRIVELEDENKRLKAEYFKLAGEYVKLFGWLLDRITTIPIDN
jgi:hypothetical protein